MPWRAARAVIEQYSAKPDNDQPSPGLKRMLRIYFLLRNFKLD